MFRSLIFILFFVTLPTVSAPSDSEYRSLLVSMEALKKEVKALKLELFELGIPNRSPHTDSEYRLLLKSVTALERETITINRELRIFDNELISNKNIQSQIDSIEVRVASIKDRLPNRTPIDTTNFVTLRQMKDIEDSLSGVKNSLISDKLLISENAKVKSELLREAKKESNTYHESDISRILVIFGIAFALVAWAVDNYYKSIIKEKMKEHDDRFQMSIIGMEKLATQQRAVEAFKNAIIYMNIANTIYIHRFCSLKNTDLNAEQNNTRRSVLHEVVSIQEYALEQLKDIFDTYRHAKAYYSLACLDLAYYLCNFINSGEDAEQSDLIKINKLLDNGVNHEKDWLKNQFSSVTEGKWTAEHSAQLIIEFIDNKQFISIHIGLVSNNSPEDTINDIRRKSLSFVKGNEHNLEHHIDKKFENVKMELLEVYKKI